MANLHGINTQAQHAKCRQLARIIKHLRDDLEQYAPQVPRPSSELIDATVGICPAHILNGDNWQSTLVQVLNYLIAATAHQQNTGEPFDSTDGYANIHFDNNLFAESECHHFYLALLDYLSCEFDSANTDKKYRPENTDQKIPIKKHQQPHSSMSYSDAMACKQADHCPPNHALTTII